MNLKKSKYWISEMVFGKVILYNFTYLILINIKTLYLSSSSLKPAYFRLDFSPGYKIISKGTAYSTKELTSKVISEGFIVYEKLSI